MRSSRGVKKQVDTAKTKAEAEKRKSEYKEIYGNDYRIYITV